MTQTISMNPLRRVRDQSGMAFALALFAMLMLTLIGYGLAVSSQGAIRVGTGFKSQKLAFEAAEGGLEYARERLRTQRAAKVTFGTMLDAARNGGALVESTSIDDFLGSNGVVNRTANLPFVGSVGLGASAFQVFLTNDPADGISSGVDTNSTVTLTSFGSGPNAVGYSVVQAEVRTALTGLVLQLPGVITLPGPTVDFQPFSGNAHKIDGEDQSANGCFPTIAVSSSQALAQVKSAIAKRSSAYTSCDPGQGPHLSGGNAVENFVENTSLTRANAYEPDTFNLPPLGSGDPRLTSVPHLTELVRKIREIADYTSPTEAGFTLGSATDPKIVVIDGDFSMSDTGNGILVVTGKLTFDGAVNYRGLVLAIGEGSVVIDGGGGGSFKGAMLVANTVEPWDDEGKWVGIPHYADNGGGNALQAYDSNGARGFPARDFAPIEVVSYHPLR